jgi:1-phosphatidylinositol phosphodiesterase
MSFSQFYFNLQAICFVKMKTSAVITIIFINFIETFAHRDSAYFRNSNDGFQERTRWMSQIPGHVRLSQLAIPGTHDSGADGKGNDILFTQCLNFDEQLRYGIRFFDIRVRHFRNSFPIHHGAFFLKKHFNNFLDSVESFLNQNPSETVLFRLKHEYNEESNSQDKSVTLNEYLKSYKRFFSTNNPRTTLDEARGKFIIMSDDENFHFRGINYDTFDIQDQYHLSSNWDLYRKWEQVRNQLYRAKDGDPDTFYLNYLSGSGGSFPYFVASGHSNPGTSAPRLSTGRTTPGWRSSYPDFPRVNCFIGICTIAFEGTNILTRNRIIQINGAREKRTVGIIIADFPGDGLIQEIINNNWILR